MHSVSQSPIEPAFVQNPYAFYNRMRALGPLVYWADYDVICATDYQTVNTLLRDRRFGREPIDIAPIPAHLKPFYDVEAHSMLEREPPLHTRLRSQVLRAFTAKRIATLRPEIEALCDTLINEFPSGPFDILDAYGRPLPARIIAKFLGVPEDSWPELLLWSNNMVAMYQASRTRADEDKAAQAATEFTAFIRAQIAFKKKNPGEDLISVLIEAVNGDALTEPELITTCILLLNAGHEATVHTFGNALKTLLETQTPPQSSASFVDEVLRHDPPLHLFERIAYEPVTIAGHTFARGDRIALLLASANHDPTVFPNPARFDPNRRGPAPLSFGAGLHFCIGAPLAKLELEISLCQLDARCPKLHLAESPRYANIYHFHGLTKLIVSR